MTPKNKKIKSRSSGVSFVTIIYLQGVCTKSQKENQWQNGKEKQCVYVCGMKNIVEDKEFNPRLEIYSNVEPACHRYQNTGRERERRQKVSE